MDVDIEVTDENPNETRDKLVKLLVGTAAGFIASRVAENAVEKVLTKVRSR